jgi:hypothetical protein
VVVIAMPLGGTPVVGVVQPAAMASVAARHKSQVRRVLGEVLRIGLPSVNMP